MVSVSVIAGSELAAGITWGAAPPIWNSIRSGPGVEFAVVIASRSEWGPVSAVVVTTRTGVAPAGSAVNGADAAASTTTTPTAHGFDAARRRNPGSLPFRRGGTAGMPTILQSRSAWGAKRTRPRLQPRPGSWSPQGDLLARRSLLSRRHPPERPRGRAP